MSAGPFVMVIFGATGDLMHKKLMPALFALYKQKEIAKETYIVGVGRRNLNDDFFRKDMAETVKSTDVKLFDSWAWDAFSTNIHYVQGLFEEDALYHKLIAKLKEFDTSMKACVPRFFYLATPPVNYEAILTHLEGSKLAEGCGHGTINFTRVLIEKPFGRDIETSKHLDKRLASIFKEKQIYRVDHYLGKETVQNILAFRFSNGIFEPTWNQTFVDHVQITLAQTDGIGSRGEFYDGVGALRDVVQNHMLALLATVAMEEPASLDAEAIRDARSLVLKHIRLDYSDGGAPRVVRGQYEGYTKENGVSASSQTETFVALKAYVDTPRWSGVPFYLRTGKLLEKKNTEISLHYKKPHTRIHAEEILRNVLSIGIAPDEAITIRLMVKRPGFGNKLAPVVMNFSYPDAFAGISQPQAYERLLLDAIAGDQTLFARTDAIEASWTFLMGILESWQKTLGSPLLGYAPKSWGPIEANDLIEKDDRRWFLGGK